MLRTGRGKADFIECSKVDFREWSKAILLLRSKLSFFFVSGSPSNPISSGGDLNALLGS